MLIELAGLLIIVGILMLVVGILIARQYTLRAKLLTAFLVIVLVSLAILALFDNYIMAKNLTASADQALVSVAKQYANRLDQFNRSNLKSIQTEARLPTITSFLAPGGDVVYNRQTILEILRALQIRHGGSVESYAVLNVDGINMIDTSNDDMGRDESGEIYFKEVVNSTLSYRSPVIFSEKSEPSIYFSSPVIDLSGRYLGVLRARYKANILNEIITSSRGLAGRGSFAVLLDENYLRLVHGRRADLRYTPTRKISEQEFQSLKNSNLIPGNVTMSYVESDDWLDSIANASFNEPNIEANFYGLGTSLFSAAVVKMETAPWSIIFAQAQEVFLEPVSKQTGNALMLASIVAVVVVFVVLGATQLLLGPIRRLTDTVQDIGEGNMSITANVETDDEIGGLARAFNEMTQNINVLIDDLEKEADEHRHTADSLRKLSQAIEQSPVSVMITDLKGNIEYVNPEFCRVTGYTAEEVKGENPRLLKSNHTQPSQYKSMWNAITSGHPWSGELYNKKKNGDLFWENVTISHIKNRLGESTHYLAIKEDISLRKDYEDRLLYQASYDKLTDLPNRSLAYDRIQQGIANAVRENNHIAILYIDFDNFKNINDTLGHTAGDKFLIAMAGRLQDCVRDVDTVARLGGDEFLVMLTEIGGGDTKTNAKFEEVVIEKTREILKEVSKPCVVEDMEFSVTASIGIAIFPEDGEDPHMLLRNSDTAMYRSKRKGRNTYEVFTPEMSDKVIKRVGIDNKLRHALDEGSFYLMYQPLMDAQTRNIVGAEALIRWEDEELGNVSPEVFIPLAEESGLITDIGEWVLDTACTDIKRWRDSKNNDTQVNGCPNNEFYAAINLSSRQFRGKGIAKQIFDTISKHNLLGGSLELEITERLLMKDVPDVIATLNQFKEMGIRLSIDDFGTGYSSLSYLKRFPFDVLKIDRAFVKDINMDVDSSSLCEAIIAMAHSLGLSVIGEGVEAEHQFDFLRNRGTEIVQGYYIGRPMIYDDFEKFISVANPTMSKQI